MGANPTFGRRSAFVGRALELALLSAARNRLAHSRGSIVLVGGDAGIGKTRLLSTFIEASRTGRPKSIVASECFERGRETFAPVRELVTALLSSAEVALAPEAQAVLRRFIGGAQTHEEVGKQSLLFHILLEVLTRSSQKRAVIFTIDDLQWADLSTLDFLRWLAPKIASLRVLIVCAYRADALVSDSPFFEAVGGLMRHPEVHPVDLRGLADDEIASVAAGQMSPTATPEALAQIVRRSAGNPFFAEALAKQFETTGDVARLPLSVRAAIASRIASLPGYAQETIARAAVIGHRFDLPLLTEACDGEAEQTPAGVAACLDAGLIETDPARPGAYRFSHPLVQQAAYESMASNQTIHARVLAALERSEHDDRYVEALAEHAYGAGDEERIRRYSERAGRALLAMGAVSDACTYFERAVDGASDLRERARLMEQLGSAYQSAGNMTRSIATWRALAPLLVENGQWDDAARVEGYLVGDVVNRTGTLDVEHADRFLSEHGAKLSEAARHRLLAFLAATTSAVERFEDAERYAGAIAHPAELPPIVRQNYLRAQMTIAAIRGEPRRWLAAAREALNVAPMIEVPFVAATAYGGIAATAMYVEARAEFDEALLCAQRLAEKHRLSGFGVYLRSVRAARAILLGDVPSAYSHATAVFQDEEVAVARQVLASCGVTIALRADDPAFAAQVMSPVLGEPHGEFHGSDGAKVLAQRAAFYLHRGDRQAGLSDLHHSVKLISWSDPSAIMVFPLAVRELPMDVALSLIEHAAAPDDDNVPARANRALCSAIVAARACREEEAAARAREAADLCGRLGWQLFEEQARELAQAGIGHGTREPDGLLSPRERDVAEAVASRMSNAAIADKLGISKKTVEKHVASIFEKLSVHSRTEIATAIRKYR